MRVFSEIGIKVSNARARDLFAAADAEVDYETGMVRLEPGLVMELIRQAPETIMLYGQKPEHTLEVGGRKVYMGTGGTALYVMDPGSDERRPAELSDLKNISRIVDAMENIHLFMLPCSHPMCRPSMWTSTGSAWRSRTAANTSWAEYTVRRASEGH